MTLESDIVHCLTDDLRRAPYKGHHNPLRGHCYVASEALYHLRGGKAAGLKPMFIQHEGAPHWFLADTKNKIIYDLTSRQFETPVPYHLAKGKGFLTAKPSARAAKVMQRVQINRHATTKPISTVCHECKGSGRIVNGITSRRVCRPCKGIGFVERDKDGTILVHRKAYTRGGTHVKKTTFRIKDLGKPGKTPKSQQFYHPRVKMGWHKDQPPGLRRHEALVTHRGDALAAAHALQALANVTTDSRTKALAKSDADYFFANLGRRDPDFGGTSTTVRRDLRKKTSVNITTNTMTLAEAMLPEGGLAAYNEGVYEDTKIPMRKLSGREIVNIVGTTSGAKVVSDETWITDRFGPLGARQIKRLSATRHSGTKRDKTRKAPKGQGYYYMNYPNTAPQWMPPS